MLAASLYPPLHDKLTRRTAPLISGVCQAGNSGPSPRSYPVLITRHSVINLRLAVDFNKHSPVVGFIALGLAYAPSSWAPKCLQKGRFQFGFQQLLHGCFACLQPRRSGSLSCLSFCGKLQAGTQQKGLQWASVSGKKKSILQQNAFLIYRNKSLILKAPKLRQPNKPLSASRGPSGAVLRASGICSLSAWFSPLDQTSSPPRRLCLHGRSVDNILTANH